MLGSFRYAVPLVLLSSAGVALAQDKAGDVQRQIESLKAQLTRLENQQQASADVSRAQASVLADAERRSQLLQAGGVSAGYDKGFFIQSGDGKFSIRPGFQFQFRSITNFAEDGKSGGSDSLESGFEVRRARFRFDGNAFGKDLKYSFVWDTNRNSGAVTLLDALVDYKFADTWGLRIGQFKESWSHEKDVSGFRQIAVDRSLLDTILGGNVTDRVQGIALQYGAETEPLRAEFAFHDGANSKNTDYRDGDGDTNARPDANYGFGGRVEYKFAGDWSAYRDFTAKGTKIDLFVLGAGFDYTEAGDSNALRATIDAQWENTTGWGLYAGLIGVFNDGDDTTDYGGLVQASYAFDPSWEVFGRYGLLLLDEDANDEDTFNEITLGVNYYLGEGGSAFHGAKVTLDFVWLPDGSPSTQTGLGYDGTSDTQFVLRGQFQLAL